MRFDKTRVDVMRKYVGVKKKEEREISWEWLHNKREKKEYLTGVEKRGLTMGPNKRTHAMQINLEIGQKILSPTISLFFLTLYLSVCSLIYSFSLLRLFILPHFSPCHPLSLSSSLLSTLSLSLRFFHILSISLLSFNLLYLDDIFPGCKYELHVFCWWRFPSRSLQQTQRARAWDAGNDLLDSPWCDDGRVMIFGEGRREIQSHSDEV